MHLFPLSTRTCAVLICDLQEGLVPVIHRSSTVVNTCRYLTSVASVLGMPMLCTQQHTKALGNIVPECFATPEIQALATTPKVFEKTKFSMLTDEVLDHLHYWNTQSVRDRFILVGIEAHVCVQQTCFEMLKRSTSNDPITVYVVVDGVSSQNSCDRAIALQRMHDAGAILTTAQSIIFEIMQTAEHENFDTVSKLTVEHLKLPNEFNGDFN